MSDTPDALRLSEEVAELRRRFAALRATLAISSTNEERRLREENERLHAEVERLRQGGEVVAYIDQADFETLEEAGWCVVHRHAADPCADHNAQVALYTSQPLQADAKVPQEK